MSRNKITIEQLCIVCRHYTELMKAGCTENMAIRQLELFDDLYAKHTVYRKVTPNSAFEIEHSRWSLEAAGVEKYL